MTSQLTRSAVRIYATLSALGNKTGNILDSLLPFFEPILRNYNGKKLDPDAIAAEIREKYRWNFNADLVETFVPHFKHHGWVIADIPKAKITTYTIQMADNSSPPSIEDDLRQIAIQFKKFSEELLPLPPLPQNVEEYEDILVEWLLYVEAFSEKDIQFGTSFESDISGTLRQVIHVPNTTSLRDEEKFLCARFVKHVIEENQSSAEVLARIAAIGLLTEVVQDFVKPVTSVDRTNLVVYLDAPVAMELLGVSGKAARENTAPIVDELIRIGASVRIFEMSLNEIKKSLQAVLRNPHPTGPTAHALLRGETLREYVTEVSLNPASFLEKMGVQATLRTIETMPGDHHFFNNNDWQDLYSQINYSANPNTRKHDTDITTLVIRQRRGKTSTDIFKSNAVVLTRNGLLAQIVRRMWTQMNGGETVPPVIHRRVLSTAIWLRTGMGSGDLNIPKRMLLSSCEYVLSIRPGVVETVKRLTDALEDEDKTHQLSLLISQNRSMQVLMDKTLGTSNVVTEENLSQLWQEMLHPHLEEERQKGQNVVNEIKAESKILLDREKEKIEIIKRNRDLEYANYNEKLEEKRREDLSAIEALCEEVRLILRRKRHIRISFGIALGLICTVPAFFPTSQYLKWPTFIVGWAFAYLTITGRTLVGISTSESQALQTLRVIAERRKLLGKLEQFDVSWNKTAFVLDSSTLSPSAEIPINLDTSGD